MKKTLLLLITALATMALHAQRNNNAVYTKQDSIRIVDILRKAEKMPANTNWMVHFARQFLGVPYGVATLENNDQETLTVTLASLDCTTIIDVVASLTMCAAHRETKFERFLYYVRQLRYRNGVVDGYCSRNHYYSQWIAEAEAQGMAHEIGANDGGGKPSPFTATQKLDLHYMTANPDKYKALRENPELIPGIRKAEEALNGRDIPYIPAAKLGETELLRPFVKDGDILALVTKKDGLDVSHLGLAIWQKDGLHLLNASSLKSTRKVIIDKRTLKDYMTTQTSQLGIRVIRMTP